MFNQILIVKLVEFKFGEAIEEEVNGLGVTEGDFLQHVIQGKRACAIVLGVALQACLNPELEPIVFNGIEDHSHGPIQIICPSFIISVQPETFACADNVF